MKKGRDGLKRLLCAFGNQWLLTPKVHFLKTSIKRISSPSHPDSDM